MGVIEFFARRPILVHLSFIILMVWGGFKIAHAPVEAYPDLPLYEVTIVTTWPGAGAEEVERLITDPLEDEFEGIADINRLQSWSQEGVSIIDIQFDQWITEQEMREHLADVRAKVDQVEDLPPDSDNPIVTYLTLDEFWPVLYVGVLDEFGGREAEAQAISRRLEQHLEEIEGVRRVDRYFQRERWLIAEVERNSLERNDLTLGEVVTAVMAESEDAPAGSLRREGEPTRETTAISAAGSIDGVDSLGERIIRRLPEGGHVSLGDIAMISDGFEDTQVRVHVNGRTAGALSIIKDSDANAMDVVNAIEEAMVEFEETELPPGFSLATTSDMTQIIRSRLRVLGLNLFQGTIIVLISMMFILGVRPAILAIIGIPFSFVAAFTVLSAMGVTINALTMFSLVLVSGMVVDDAIIVLENLTRHYQRGKRGVRAVLDALQEVYWPVIAAVATSIAAFVPMLMMGGVVGKFFEIIPKTVIAVLAASLVECLFILPGHFLEFGATRRLRQGIETETVFGRARRRIDNGIREMADHLSHVVNWLIDRRGWVLSFAVVLLIFSLGLGMHLRQVLWPSDFQVFMVRVASPPGSNIEQTAELTTGIESVIDRFREGSSEWDPSSGRPNLVISHISTIGRSIAADNATMEQDPVVAMGLVELTDPGAVDPVKSVGIIREEIIAYLEEHPETPTTFLDVSSPQDGPPTGKPVAARVFCGNYEEGRMVAERIRTFLSGVDGVVGLDISLRPGLRNAELVLNEHMAGAYDLTFDAVARELQFANFGAQVGRWFDTAEGERVEVWLRLAEDDRDSLADLAHVPVRTPAGALIDIQDVGDFQVTEELSSRYRREGRRCVMLTADVDTEVTTSAEVNKLLLENLGRLTEGAPSVDVMLGGEYEESAKSFQSLQISFLVALLLIFTILSVQFNSAIQPMIVASTIPFALGGVVVGMWVCDHISTFVAGRGLFPFTYVTGIALVGLAGVVVNDSLVLVDFINQARRKGEDLREAVLHGVRVRFRAIMLTTITTVGGLAPMALGTGGYSIIWSPFAAALIFGMVSSTVMNLLLVPCFYVIAEDIRRVKERVFKGPEDPHIWPGAVRD